MGHAILSVRGACLQRLLQRKQEGTMSTEKNKAIMRRVNDELISQGRMEVADELFTPTFVDHSALPGVPPTREGVKQLFAMFRAAL
jgi:predicted SnoaL-like aldol condensation-catalyzing enzyme